MSLKDSFHDWKEKRKVKKGMEEVEHKDERLDVLEESNNARMEVAERKGEQQLRENALEWRKKQLDEDELRNAVREARSDLWVVRDNLYNIIRRSAKDCTYLSKQPDSPGKSSKMKKSEKRLKNALYALTLVEQTLERLDEIPSEYEWQKVMQDLTDGYKAVNAISLGSDWMTRFSLLMQKAKMEMKGNVSTVSMEKYFGKPIDQLLQEEEVDQVATDILVKAKADNLADMSKQDILEAARNGVFVTVQPQEFVSAAKQAEEQMKQEQGFTEKVFVEESQPMTKEISLRESENMINSLGQ